MNTSNLTVDSTTLVYFLAGALLPTIALYFMNKRQDKAVTSDVQYSNDSNDDESDDDDFVTKGQQQQNNSMDNAKNWNLQHAPYKMVLCVNTALSMGKGKIAAQCCHAAVGCYKRAVKQCPNGVAAWERTGCAKICVKCPENNDNDNDNDGSSEFETIAALAMSKGIPVYLVEDAGRTQIAAGSRTVLGLGPAPVAVFEGVTDHLKLM